MMLLKFNILVVLSILKVQMGSLLMAKLSLFFKITALKHHFVSQHGKKHCRIIKSDLSWSNVS